MGKRRAWGAATVGVVIALIGAVLAAGGAWLAVLGGSLYYLLTGVAMIVSGVLLVRGRMLGAWLYIAIVAVTVLWAFADSQGNLAWALVPRIFAPIVLLIAVVIGGIYLFGRQGSENRKDAAISSAAKSVGGAADKVGDAVEGGK